MSRYQYVERDVPASVCIAAGCPWRTVAFIDADSHRLTAQHGPNPEHSLVLADDVRTVAVSQVAEQLMQWFERLHPGVMLDA